MPNTASQIKAVVLVDGQPVAVETSFDGMIIAFVLWSGSMGMHGWRPNSILTQAIRGA